MTQALIEALSVPALSARRNLGSLTVGGKLCIPINKYGQNGAVGTSWEPIVGSGSPIYLVDNAASAVTVEVSAANANDTSAGTGLRTVYIEGLDDDWNIASEVVTLAGQTPVNTVNQYRCIFFMRGRTAGSSLTNAGAVYCSYGATITTGVPDSNIMCSMLADSANSLHAAYTIPAGYTGHYVGGNVTARSSGTNYLTIELRQRQLTEPWRTARRVVVASQTLGDNPRVSIPFPEKTHLEARAISSGGTGFVTADFELILVPN